MHRPAHEIATRDFSTVRKGYDPVEVRAFLTELANEVSDPALEGATSRAATMLEEADRAVADRLAEADRITAAARAEADRLRGEGEAIRAESEEQRETQERELAERLASLEIEVTAAEGRAAQILDDARADAAAAYQGRWREAGDTVTRILEAAQDEAAALIEAAEAVATEIRRQLGDDLRRTRADAEQDAAEVRARADEYVEDGLASTRAELAEAHESLASVRADAARIEAEASTRATDLVRRAEEQVSAQVHDQLAQAQADLDRVRAVEAEAAARLGRVRELVDKALATVSEAPAGAIDDPGSFLRSLEGPPEPVGDSGVPAASLPV